MDSVTTPPPSRNSFSTQSTLAVGSQTFAVHLLPRLASSFGVERLPYSLKVLLENLLRHEDGQRVSAADVQALSGWADSAGSAHEAGMDRPEIAFSPERVLMQDFTGVPGVVDLAAMRDALASLSGDARRVNPLVPVELVIDHSVIVESSGSPGSFDQNVEIEYRRNGERYQLLRWAQSAFENFHVVPPGTGICHQVNLERLARVVTAGNDGWAFPDTLVGTDSHTTMVNGIGVLGWGVGGIEAEAAMLGQPLTMLVPPVVGFRIAGELDQGVTATDLVLTVTQMLRRHGVVGKFVEFFGQGLDALGAETRATISNMAPEYGATCAIFPVDGNTLAYLRFTGRSDEQVDLVEAYTKEQGMFRQSGEPEPVFSEVLELDLSTVEASLAGPSRPQDRVALSGARQSFRSALGASRAAGPESAAPTGTRPGDTVELRSATIPGAPSEVADGHVVIAAITSCTNTSNPMVMLAAGLLAKKAVERGLRSKPWVKTSLAPGSRVVMDYLERAGVTSPLAELGFDLVGFGCTTCIGNSGPLLPGVGEAVDQAGLSVAAVLSGNRNFEGRVHPQVRMNYLASPPLVVAYALAGTMDLDLTADALGTGSDGRPVFLRDIWPSADEVRELAGSAITSEMFRERYASVFTGDERWRSLPIPEGGTFEWSADSTYVLPPPFFSTFSRTPEPVRDVRGARVLAWLGDSVTTDHISPAGSISPASPAGQYLLSKGVERADFNSYGARRGNHEVMMRGTFANVRLRNRLAPGTEGGVTVHQPSGEQMSIYDAAARYRDEGTPLVVLAGKEYGSGSSRDWAAKGTALLGVKAVVAESFERIHRSNLVGMGVLPLELPPGTTLESSGLDPHETFDIIGVEELGRGEIPKEVLVRAGDAEVAARLRIDTPMEAEYYRNGGILAYVLRQLAG